MKKKRHLSTGFKACREVKNLPAATRIELGWGAYRRQWTVAREDGTHDVMQRRVNPRTGMDVTEVIDWVRVARTSQVSKE